MPVYKLEPIEGTENHGDWWASSLSPTTVWVRAHDPDHARHRMHVATRMALASDEGIKAPWISAALVRCTEDSSFEVPSDKALLANGKITIEIP